MVPATADCFLFDPLSVAFSMAEGVDWPHPKAPETLVALTIKVVLPMKKLLLAVSFCLLTSITAHADPFVILPDGNFVFNTSFSTTGTFTCSVCTGSGTNSVTFGAGADTVTLTFTGVNTTLQIDGIPTPVTVGRIEVAATGSGFVFPTPSNPNVPLLTLNLELTQTSPTAGVRTLQFTALGGSSSLILSPLFSDHFQFPVGTVPPGIGFTHIVYVFKPITIPNTSGIVTLNSDISAVPEPTSMLLLGSGALLLWARKRRSRR